jgi:hypothetical protein
MGIKNAECDDNLNTVEKGALLLGYEKVTVSPG